MSAVASLPVSSFIERRVSAAEQASAANTAACLAVVGERLREAEDIIHQAHARFEGLAFGAELADIDVAADFDRGQAQASHGRGSTGAGRQLNAVALVLREQADALDACTRLRAKAEKPVDAAGSPDLLTSYFRKMAGSTSSKGVVFTVPSAVEVVASALGCGISILLVCVVHYVSAVPASLSFIMASLGATAIILFGIPSSPLATPRHCLGGNLIAAVVGVPCRLLYTQGGCPPYVAAGLAVGLTMLGMHTTDTVHPPAGATALIAVVSSDAGITLWSGFIYIFLPVLSSTLMIVLTALLFNNLVPGRRYPAFWLWA